MMETCGLNQISDGPQTYLSVFLFFLFWGNKTVTFKKFLVLLVTTARGF